MNAAAVITLSNPFSHISLPLGHFLSSVGKRRQQSLLQHFKLLHEQASGPMCVIRYHTKTKNKPQRVCSVYSHISKSWVGTQNTCVVGGCEGAGALEGDPAMCGADAPCAAVAGRHAHAAPRVAPQRKIYVPTSNCHLFNRSVGS